MFWSLFIFLFFDLNHAHSSLCDAVCGGDKEQKRYKNAEDNC